MFSYTAMHSVVETDTTRFQDCSTSNSILKDNNGNKVVPLKTIGKNYFICGTPRHYSGGMKFNVSLLHSPMPTTNSTSNSPNTTALA